MWAVPQQALPHQEPQPAACNERARHLPPNMMARRWAEILLRSRSDLEPKVWSGWGDVARTQRGQNASVLIPP